MKTPILGRRQFWSAVFAILCLTVAIRLPSLLHPQPIDSEGMYSVVANEIIDGGLPYVDAVERKPPLLFWTYTAIFKLAGKFNWPALHIVALVWTLCVMAGLYFIGRELFGRNTGLTAALLYTVFQPWAIWKNLTLDGEMLMNLPIVWAWAIGLRRSSLRFRPELFAAGGLLGAAFLFKQPAAIAAMPLGVYLLLPSYRKSRGLKPTDSILHAAILTTGFFSVLGVVASVLWKQGILSEALYWTIADHDVPHFFWTKGLVNTLGFVVACLPLLLGAAMACRDRSGVWIDKPAERSTLLGLLAASAIGAAAGARFYAHYYVQLIPPLALLAAPHYALLWTGQVQPPYWLLRPRLTYVWLTLTVIVFSVSHWIGLSSRRHSSKAGRYILEHSAPNDRIFVWGQISRIYLDAQRRPACRYIETFPLTGYVFGGPIPGLDTRSRILPWAWATLEQDFAKHPPAYIVDIRSDVRAVYPPKDFPILEKLLAQHYEPVAQTSESAQTPEIVIYRRNNRP